jgi:adenosylmethionine-8-amino-7-oxononanoate aminotransferase
VTDVAIFKDTYAQLLTQSAQMPSPDFRLAEAGEGAEAFALRCADALETYVAAHHESLAAFIIEPLVQCAAGMGMYHPIYLKRAREICTQYLVHLIADEIAVGFGRTGTMFASYTDCDAACTASNCCKNIDCRPDFMCLSKGITGGYLPLSCVLTKDEIYQAFYDDKITKAFLHSHSYTGNPLACSAALATLSIFETDNVIQKNQETSDFIWQKMKAFNDISITYLRRPNLNQSGMIFAVDIVTKNPNFARDCYAAALENNLLVRPIGNTIYLMPPYSINHEEVEHALQASIHAASRACK